jgi:2-(1,2-epoxy-1,2-dihydrophenyl)acetyl-CoA isomerase
MSEPTAPPTVLHDIQGDVAIVTFNRPQALNSFTGPMNHDLWAVLDTIEANPAVRACVFTGAGRGFCAGADLGGIGAVDADGKPVRSDPGVTIENNFNPTARRLQNLRMPTVAAVNGVAAGAGVSIAMGCDVVFAAPGASFIQAFSKIGLIPDVGGTWLLPERLGLARAMALAMTGDRLSAQQAKDWGMIWEVADDCLGAATAFAKRLAAMPTKALVATRHTLRAAATNTFNQQLDLERDTQSALGKTYDAMEGINAFLEKRAPVFRGE